PGSVPRSGGIVPARERDRRRSTWVLFRPSALLPQSDPFLARRAGVANGAVRACLRGLGGERGGGDHPRGFFDHLLRPRLGILVHGEVLVQIDDWAGGPGRPPIAARLGWEGLGGEGPARGRPLVGAELRVALGDVACGTSGAGFEIDDKRAVRAVYPPVRVPVQ